MSPTRGRVSTSSARRLVLRDEVVIDQAIELTRAKGWLLVKEGPSVSLTAEGRRKVKV